MRLLFATLFAVLTSASPAFASSVTNVTLDNTVPSNATSAETVYRVGFKATTAFSGATGGQITVTVPAGTTFPGFSGLITRSNGAQIGGCGSPSGLTVVCSLNAGQAVAAAENIVVVLRGVANPGVVGPVSAQVHTTTDTQDAGSTNNATVVAGQTIAPPTVNIAQPSAAAGARTVYRVDFQLTSTGGLAGEAGSRIVVTMPPGTTYNNFGATISDVTAGNDLGGCTQSGVTITCPLNFSAVAAAGHQMRLTLRGVINGPVNPARSVSVHTTSDIPDRASQTFAIVEAQAVSAVAVNNTVPTAASGARTVYRVDFTLSSTGGLAGEAGSQITATLPAGTTFNNFGATITDTTADDDLGGCTQSGVTITCPLNFSAVAAAGHQMRLTLRGVVNESAGAGKIVKVTTTSDVSQTVDSAPFSVVAGHSLTDVSVNPGSPSAAAGARTVYRVDFTLSATGGLAGEAGSAITLRMPGDTTYNNFGATITDRTSGVDLGGCGGPAANVITCPLNFSASAAAGHQMRVTLRGVVNGAAGTGKLVRVSTTSDLPTVDSAGFAIVGQHSVSNVAVDHATPSPAAGARTRYNVDFTLSGTGGLAGEGGSAIVTSFPAGTTFGPNFGATIIDLSRNNAQLGGCGGPSGTTVTCPLNFSAVAAAGDRLRINFRGVVNTAAGADLHARVNTTSDLAQVDSAPFEVVAGHAISGVNVAVGSTAGSATSAYVVSFTTSQTGGLRGEANSTVDITFPAGTTVGAGSAQFTRGGTSLGGCAPVNSQIQRCSLNFSSFTLPGDQIRIRFPQVTNPVAGASPLTVSTTSDITPVQSSAPAVNPLDTAITDGPDPISNDPSPTFVFTGTGSGFQCRVDNNAFTACNSPHTPGNLTDGSHTYQVRATDGAGGFDQTPDSMTFVIKTSAPETTLTDGPSNPTADSTPTFQFTGTGDGFECKVDGGGFSACAPGFTTSVLSNGSHTVQVRATDLAGNVDQTPASQTFVVGAPLDTTITSGPSGSSNDTTPTFTFTGTGEGFECRVDNDAFAPCSSPFTTEIGAGQHTFQARATFDTDVDTTPAARTFVIDTAAPEPVIQSGPDGPTSSSTPTFTFSAAEAGSTFTCSLDGGAFSACASPYTTPALAAGDHVFAVRARDAAGNTSTTTRAFTVTVAQEQTATPTPQPEQTPIPTPSASPSPTPAPTATPVPNQSVVGEPVSGTVLVCQSPGVKCTPLQPGQSIQVGSTVDAKKGRVEITAVPKAGQPAETAVFYDGIFKLTQKGGVTDLALVEPLAPCGKSAKASAGTKAKKRRLWGEGKGNFRTTGKYAAATVRGTKWLVEDSCAGTLTKVAEGVVSVRDKVKGKTIVVRAPKSYTARPKR